MSNTTRPHTPSAEIGVIGGTGLYALLDEFEEVTLDTPYGSPSDPIAIGSIADRHVAFLPSHGRDHRYPPHRIPYHANLWALRALGARQILAPSAVGSLRGDYGAGTLVVPDQIVDRTSGRRQTFYEHGGPVHVSFADPYCPVGRETALAAVRASGWAAVDGGSLVVIEGPRFSTRAESQWYAAQGWSLVGMTAQPEAVLAREIALCYTTLALVTDLDAGVAEGEGVSQAEVLRVFAANIEHLRTALFGVIAALPQHRECPCPEALAGMTLPIELP